MKIKVCKGKTCKDRFSEYIVTRLENDKGRLNLKKLEIEDSLCMGQCKKGPNILVDGDMKNYITPVKASEFALNKSSGKKKKNNINKKK